MVEKIRLALLAAVILNVCFSTPSFCQTEEKNITMPFSQNQIDKLAEIIKTQPSVGTEYDQGAVFKWVCLEFDGSIPLNLRDGIIKCFSKSHVVYLNPQDIPEQNIIGYSGEYIPYKVIPSYRDGKGVPSYKDGFEFYLRIEQRDNKTIEVFFHYNEGGERGGFTSIVYSWNGTDWVKVSQGMTAMN